MSQQTRCLIKGNTYIHWCKQFKKAYEAIAFISQDGELSLIISKICVSPIKELTLLKLYLELMAAVINIRLYKFILTSLSPQYLDILVFLWSDSQTHYSARENWNPLLPVVCKRSAILSQLPHGDNALHKIILQIFWQEEYLMRPLHNVNSGKVVHPGSPMISSSLSGTKL